MKLGRRLQGSTEYKKHLAGEKLTRNQSIRAKCYECEGGYLDGKQVCNIPECPLYPYNPYVIASQNQR